jgi:hypothetical protein
LAVLLLLVLASAPIFMMKSAAEAARKQARNDGRSPEDGKATKRTKETIKSLLQGNNSPEEPSTAANNSAAPPVAAPTSLTLNATEVAEVTAKTNSHDYAGVAEILRKASGADSDDGKAMIKKYEDLTALQKWLNSEILNASDTAPIETTIEGQSVRVYATKEGTVIDNGTPTTRNLWEYKETTISAIAEAIAAKPPSGQVVPAEAVGWIAIFRDVHKV